MSPSKSVLPSDAMLVCHHIVGITPSQISGPGLGPLVYATDQDRLRIYGGMKFSYCPICGLELEDDE